MNLEGMDIPAGDDEIAMPAFPAPEPERAPEPEPALVSHGTAICENEGCKRKFRIGPVTLARMEAGQPVICRRCYAAAA